MRNSTVAWMFGLGIALSASALADQPVIESINQCAALLPKGKVYTFDIKGTVDTSKTTNWLHSKTEVGSTDQNNDPKKFQKEIEPFAKCLGGD